MADSILNITHPTEITPEILKNIFKTKNIKGVDFSKEVGVDSTNVSAWINGTRPMSNTVKALFYYYFKTKELSKD